MNIYPTSSHILSRQTMNNVARYHRAVWQISCITEKKLLLYIIKFKRRLINREFYVSVFWYQVYKARLWEGLLTSRGFPSDLTCVLKVEPGKHDIKRLEPGILFISLPIVLLTLQTCNYDLIFDFCVESVIGDIIQKVQRHHGLIKAHAAR